MKFPPQLVGAFLTTAGFVALLSYLWDKPADISHFLLPRQNKEWLKNLFLYSERSITLEDGTAVIEKRYRVPTNIVDPALQIPSPLLEHTPSNLNSTTLQDSDFPLGSQTTNETPQP